MSVRTLSTRRPFFSLTPAFNDLFEPWNEWFQDGAAGKQLSLPRVNITEDSKNYSLELAAPGLHKKDFKIDINNNVLTVSAQREESKEEKDKQYTRQEYSYSSFSRSFTLPEEVEQDKVEATYDGGILKIALPKNAKVTKQNHKAISIK